MFLNTHKQHLDQACLHGADGICLEEILNHHEKKKVLQQVLQAMPENNQFWFHKESFSQRLFKEPSLSYLFIIWKTFFHHKEPLVKQKGSSDVKGSSWNHLHKKMYSMASWSTFIFKSVLAPHMM